MGYQNWKVGAEIIYRGRGLQCLCIFWNSKAKMLGIITWCRFEVQSSQTKIAPKLTEDKSTPNEATLEKLEKVVKQATERSSGCPAILTMSFSWAKRRLLNS